MQRYPLQWPVGYPRADRPKRSAFKNPTLGKTVDLVIREVARLVGEFYPSRMELNISSNVPLRNDGLPRADYLRSNIKDKGVAVYFKYNDKDVVMCCDKWDTVESNLHAIYLSIEALRSIDRWGVSDFIDRSFTGFKALPETTVINWREVLCHPKTFKEAQDIYRSLAKTRHPDTIGGSSEKFHELNEAYEQAKIYFKA